MEQTSETMPTFGKVLATTPRKELKGFALVTARILEMRQAQRQREERTRALLLEREDRDERVELEDFETSLDHPSV